MAHRDPGLLHRGRGEGGKADDVPGRIDVGHGRLVVLVHGEATPRARGEAGALEGEAVGGALAPHREQHARGEELFAAAQPPRDFGPVEPHRFQVRVEAYPYAEQLDLEPQPIGDLAIEERQQPVLAADERDLDAEGAEHRRVLTADHPSAHDRQRARDALHVQDRVAVVEPDRVAGHALSVTLVWRMQILQCVGGEGAWRGLSRCPRLSVGPHPAGAGAGAGSHKNLLLLPVPPTP